MRMKQSCLKKGGTGPIRLAMAASRTTVSDLLITLVLDLHVNYLLIQFVSVASVYFYMYP
jgi:hypothetical protein